MITKIGIVSGEILTILERMNRPMSIKSFESFLDEPSEMILMSIGWLAREGYIHLEMVEGECLISRMAEHYSPV